MILHDGDDYMAVIPLTERSSCYYGKNTKWCVSVVSDDNMFTSYVAAGKFPIHIFKDNEVFSAVYDIISGGYSEMRDSNNDDLRSQAWSKTRLSDIVPMSDITKEVQKNIRVLENLSKKMRLRGPKEAFYYSHANYKRFEEGEPIIAKDFLYSLHYMSTILNYKRNSTIDDAIMSNISNFDEYVNNEMFDEYYSIAKKYLVTRFIDDNEILPRDISITDLEKHFSSFLIKYAIKHKIVYEPEKLIDMYKKANSNQNKTNKVNRMRSISINGTGRYGILFDYLYMIFKNNKDLKPYIKSIGETEQANTVGNRFVKYIIAHGYEKGFSDVVLNELKYNITLEEIYDIIRRSKNGEEIMKEFDVTDFPPETLFDLIDINKKVIDILGGIPTAVKKLMKDNNLSLK